MSTNGHNGMASARRIVEVLKIYDGRATVRELRRGGISGELISDVMEGPRAGWPFTVEVQRNGGRPKVLLVLKQRPPEYKPVSQEEAAARLNQMSPQEFLEHCDPTYRLRRQRRAGGGARTSTSADEYLGTNGE